MIVFRTRRIFLFCYMQKIAIADQIFYSGIMQDLIRSMYYHSRNIWGKLCDIAHYGRGWVSVFRGIFTSTGRVFILGGGGGGEAGGWATNLWSFGIFLILPNFLRSQVLSCAGTCEATYMHHFIINNYASFHLWWKENLFNHQ